MRDDKPKTVVPMFCQNDTISIVITNLSSGHRGALNPWLSGPSMHCKHYPWSLLRKRKATYTPASCYGVRMTLCITVYMYGLYREISVA